jgi:hypothetical protein
MENYKKKEHGTWKENFFCSKWHKKQSDIMEKLFIFMWKICWQYIFIRNTVCIESIKLRSIVFGASLMKTYRTLYEKFSFGKGCLMQLLPKPQSHNFNLYLAHPNKFATSFVVGQNLISDCLI